METSNKSNLEIPLCSNSNQQRNHELEAHTFVQWCCIREDVVEEAKKQLWLAGPLIAVSLLQYSLQMISIMFVGHLGKLPLSGASLGNSFASVTGYSVLVSGLCSFFSNLLDLLSWYVIYAGSSLYI
jgi:MATE family multidrug resistance protein